MAGGVKPITELLKAVKAFGCIFVKPPPPPPIVFKLFTKSGFSFIRSSRT